MPVQILVILITIFYIKTLQPPGRLNPKYKIDNYFGSRLLCKISDVIIATNLSDTFLYDQPTIVQWSDGNFVHHKNSNLLWIADRETHTIKLIKNSIRNFKLPLQMY